jgi:hypothetical protein
MTAYLFLIAFWAPIFALQYYTRNRHAMSDMDI